jgi:acyl-CoA thioesterase FadM
MTRRILLSDVDAAGVLFCARGLAIAHDGYEQAMAAAGLPLEAVIQGRRYALPLVRAEIDFRAALRQGDEIETAVRLLEIGSSSYVVSCTLLKAGSVAVAVKQVHVHLDLASMRASPVPPELAAALGRLGAAAAS